MQGHYAKKREEARRMFLTGECETNREIARRLHVKGHTIGKWRRDEDWDNLRLKIDRRAGEMFVDKLATDRVALNVKHYRFWDLLLTSLGEALKDGRKLDVRELDKIGAILDRVQRGQRLSKGLASGGETEELIRAQSQAEIRRLIDVFIDSVKENVSDEKTREHIRRALLDALPATESAGASNTGDEGAD
jgi:hypothetical protein